MIKTPTQGMEVTIVVLSFDDELSVNEATTLKKEIEFNVDEASVQQAKKQVQKDDAAFGMLDAVVKVLVGKDFLLKVVEVIDHWMGKRADVAIAKRPKIQMEVKDENGKTTSLVIENVKDLEQVIKLTEILNTQNNTK